MAGRSMRSTISGHRAFASFPRIEPCHRLTIASSENVVALVVFLIAAVVVGRLAASARQRAREAEDRARQAAAREREAAMLARAASDVMAGTQLETELEAVGRTV